MKWVVSSDEEKKALSESKYSEENLIRGYVSALLDSYSFNKKTAIVCGNGETGLIGKELSLQILDSTLFVTNTKETKYKEKPIYVIDNNTSFSDYDVIVDALIDTDFTGLIDDYNNMIINKINNSHKKVISIDLNSGLDSTSGLGNCIVKSDLTVSLNNFKYGHFLNMAKDYINDKINYSFGIKIDTKCSLLELPDFKDILLERKNYSNKYDYGVSCILGGSNNFSGSIKLANMASAAMRSGVGLSRLAVPANMAQSVLPHVIESTVCTIESKFGQMVFNKKDIDDALKDTNCLVIGMGWGKSREYSKILNYILNNYDKPIIIDADGINTLKDMDLSILKSYKNKIIITPHINEFSRITKKDVNKILLNPVKNVEEFANKWGIVVVLKGPTTIISDGEKTYLVNRGCSGMATAGSGDVLSGILGGLLAWSEYDLLVVGAGVFINGLAGEEAENEVGAISMLATDTIKHIPTAIKKMKSI
ncbi:MAG: NAD(P)H-hydrate dehydratase [Bacilli bacterium]|nr:NAD(P)H-hydrate dehydratase [Bacilli bacterium]